MPLERIPVPGDFIRYIHQRSGNPTWYEVATVHLNTIHEYGIIRTVPGMNEETRAFYYDHPSYPYEFRDPKGPKKKSGFAAFMNQIENEKA